MNTINDAAGGAEAHGRHPSWRPEVPATTEPSSVQLEEAGTRPGFVRSLAPTPRRVSDGGTPIRVALVGPVATSIPPPRSSSVELLTGLLCEGLVSRGHQVSLFATGTSRTSAKLHATFAKGYADDPTMWPWDVCEVFNLAAAV